MHFRHSGFDDDVEFSHRQSHQKSDWDVSVEIRITFQTANHMWFEFQTSKINLDTVWMCEKKIIWAGSLNKDEETPDTFTRSFGTKVKLQDDPKKCFREERESICLSSVSISLLHTSFSLPFFFTAIPRQLVIPLKAVCPVSTPSPAFWGGYLLIVRCDQLSHITLSLVGLEFHSHTINRTR